MLLITLQSSRANGSVNTQNSIPQLYSRGDLIGIS